MGSEILTLSEDEIKNIKKKLADIIGSSYVNNIKEIDEESVNDFAINDEEYIKKHKNLFIVSDKKDRLLDLEINLKELSSLTDDIDFQIKFEGYRIAFIDSQSEENIKIKQNLYFSNCDFKAIELKNICFEKFEIDGYKYGNDHKKSIVFNACEFKELFLKNNTFSENVKFIEKTKIEYLHVELNKFSKYFFIQDCIIRNASLNKNNNFEGECYFIDTYFGCNESKVVDGDSKYRALEFSFIDFKNDVYFNNSVFYGYVDFYGSKFEKLVNFYGAVFKTVPIFSACYFREQRTVILTSVDIYNLDFGLIEKYIEDNYKVEVNTETYSSLGAKEKTKINHIGRLRYAKLLKDSFRVVKDVLIIQNNILEAQEWHKLELYAKEIELEIRLDKDRSEDLKKECQNQRYNPNDYKKSNRSKIKTSILKLNFMTLIFSSLLPISYVLFLPFFLFYAILITLRSIMRSGVGLVIRLKKIFHCFYLSIAPLDKEKFLIFWKAKINRIMLKLVVFGRKMLDYTLWFDCVLLQIYRNTSNHHTNFLKILNFTILMIVLYAIFGLLLSSSVNFLLSFEPTQIAVTSFIVFFILFATISNVKKQLYLYGIFLFFIIFGVFIMAIVTFFSLAHIEALYFLIYFMGVVFFYILFTCKIKIIVFIVRVFAYVGLMGVVVIKPQLVNPFVGVFSSDKLYDSKFEKKLGDLNVTAIMVLASFSQGNFNLPSKDQKISFTELNSAKTSVIANQVKLKEILSKVYDDKYESTYKKVLSELENNTSNIKNIIKAIDNNNNNSIISSQLYKFIKSDFTQGVDFLYAVKDAYSISAKLLPEQLVLFEQKDSQDKLKNILSLLKFKSSFEEILNFIKQDEITSNVIKSTSVLYSIILLLCIFSLQKTARKNSIVPS
ncbi:pentapeptide repeat-containing protein [Campylobacter lari]|nr:pentapeptide repeat-containing protein [Campylobacter lari]